MSRDVSLDNFEAYELVSPEAYELFGDRVLYMFNKEFLQDVDKFISDLKKDTGCSSVYVNTWKWGGGYVASGLRDLSALAGSLGSQHYLGNAFDLKFKGITIDEAYDYLLANQAKYPAIKRIEDLDYTRSNNKYGGWLHLDGKDDGKSTIKVFLP